MQATHKHILLATIYMLIIQGATPSECFCRDWKRNEGEKRPYLDNLQIRLHAQKKFTYVRDFFLARLQNYNDLLEHVTVKNPGRFGPNIDTALAAWNERKKYYSKLVILHHGEEFRFVKTVKGNAGSGFKTVAIPCYRVFVMYKYPGTDTRPDIFVYDIFSNKILKNAENVNDMVGLDYSFTKTRITKMTYDLPIPAKQKLAKELGMSLEVGPNKVLTGDLVTWMSAWDNWEGPSDSKGVKVPLEKRSDQLTTIKLYNKVSGLPKSGFTFPKKSFSYFEGQKLEYDICLMVAYQINTMLRHNRKLNFSLKHYNNYVDELSFLDDDRTCFSAAPPKEAFEPAAETVRTKTKSKPPKAQTVKIPGLKKFQEKMTNIVIQNTKKTIKKIAKPKPIIQSPKSKQEDSKNKKPQWNSSTTIGNKKKKTQIGKVSTTKELKPQKTGNVNVKGGNQKTPVKIQEETKQPTNVPKVTINLNNPNDIPQDEIDDTPGEDEEDEDEEDVDPEQKKIELRQQEEDNEVKRQIVEQVLHQSFKIIRPTQPNPSIVINAKDKELVDSMKEEPENTIIKGEEEEEEDNPVEALVVNKIIEVQISETDPKVIGKGDIQNIISNTIQETIQEAIEDTTDDPNQETNEVVQVVVEKTVEVVIEEEGPDDLNIVFDEDQKYYDFISKVESSDPEPFSNVVTTLSLLLQTSALRKAPSQGMPVIYERKKGEKMLPMFNRPHMLSPYLQMMLKIYFGVQGTGDSMTPQAVTRTEDASPMEITLFCRYALYKRILVIWNLALKSDMAEVRKSWLWTDMSITIYQDGSIYSEDFRMLRKLIIHALCYHRYVQIHTINFETNLDILDTTGSKSVLAFDEKNKASVLNAAIKQKGVKDTPGEANKVTSRWETIRSKINVQSLTADTVMVKLLELTNPNVDGQITICQMLNFLLIEWVYERPLLQGKKIYFIEAISWECEGIDKEVKQAFGTTLVNSLERRALSVI